MDEIKGIKLPDGSISLQFLDISITARVEDNALVIEPARETNALIVLGESKIVFRGRNVYRRGGA